MKKKNYPPFRSLLLALILFFISCFVYSDEGNGSNPSYTPNLIPPSPTTSGLGNYGYIPVGLFTGTPNISIPLHTFTTKNLSLPISLSYSSNGVKVDQIASWVGMSWSLNAGGVVTRIVKDEADDLNYRFIPDYLGGNSFETKIALEKLTDYPMIDSEPDLFAFNFNGYSGQFVLDENFEPVIIPFQNIKIETDFDISVTESITEIIITTPDGVRYYFGGEDCIETTKTYSVGPGCGHGESYEPINNAWYLKKIEHPLGDIINFTYNLSSYNYRAGVSQTVRKSLTQFPGCEGASCGSETQTTCTTRLQVKTRHLAEISSPYFGRIVFNSVSDRMDLPAEAERRLTAISIKDVNEQQIKRFEFEHITSTSRSGITDSDLDHRLFLKSISLKDGQNNNIGKYEFFHNDINALPPRLDYAQDHWGYFNGARHNYDFVPNVPDVYGGILENVGGDREPNSDYAGKGLLTKIIYPTGGYNKLEYEANTYNTTRIVYPPTEEEYVIITGIEDHFIGQSESSDTFSPDEDQSAFVSANVIYEHPTIGYDPIHHFAYLRVYENGEEILEKKLYKDGSYSGELDLNPTKSYYLTVTAHGPGTTINGTIHYYLNAQTTEIINKETGGNRIKRITTFDVVEQKEEITRYYYAKSDDLNTSTGSFDHEPIYYQAQTLEERCPQGYACNTFECNYLMLYSNSVSNLYNLGANNIVYSHVLVSKGENFENGCEEYKFRIRPDVPANSIRGNPIIGTTYTNEGWENGIKEYVKTLKKNGSTFTTLAETHYHYKTDSRINKELKGISVRKNFDQICENIVGTYTCTEADDVPLSIYCDADHDHSTFYLTNLYPPPWLFYFGPPPPGGFQLLPEYKIPYCFKMDGSSNFNDTTWHPCHYAGTGNTIEFVQDLRNFDVMTYNILSKWQYIEYETNIQYDENGANPVTRTTYYDYDNPVHALVSQIRTFDSEDNEIVRKIYYPEDYNSGTPEIDQLIANNITGIPIDERTYKDNSLTSGKLTKYNPSGQPVEVYIAESELGSNPLFYSGNPYSYGEKKLSLSYAGNILLYYQIENGYTTSFLWGYNLTYPVAKIVNASYSDAEDAINYVSNYLTLQGITSDDDLINIFNDMRDDYRMENAQIYSYTYKPSVGLTSVTDPMKVTSRYEYDHFARLKNTLDVNKDIRQKNVYHYMDPSSNYINVYNPSNAIVNFDEDADYEYAYINSNVTWQTQSPANWITLNKTSGSSTSIRITVDENDSYMSRSEQIILQGYLVDAVINVIQVGKPYPSIIPEETEINFGPTAENQTISVEATNTNWTVNIEQDGNWLSVSPTQGGENTDLTFSCDQWSYYGTRYADVTLQGANAVAHISVSQDGVLSPYIMCADYVDFESQCTNEEFTLNINSNETWSYALSGTNSWFSVTTSGNSGESTMTITCEHDNVHSTPRVGYITLTSSNCLHLITVTQAADTN